jgi:hypothetical protein
MDNDVSRLLRELREAHGYSRARVAMISGGKLSERMVEHVEARPYGGDNPTMMTSVATYISIFHGIADRRTMSSLRRALIHAVRRASDLQIERLLKVSDGVDL